MKKIKNIIEAQQLIELALKEGKRCGKEIETIVIDSRNSLPSASKIRNRDQV